MKKKYASIAGALIYACLGAYAIISTYNCVGWFCDLPAFIVALPWAKLWDSDFNRANVAIYNGIGVIVNSVIIYFVIFYILKISEMIVNKLKHQF